MLSPGSWELSIKIWLLYCYLLQLKTCPNKAKTKVILFQSAEGKDDQRDTKEGS